jgi:four helix bundle protein
MQRAVQACMGVYRFEDLRVWQAARKQSECIAELMKRPELLADAELSAQINRASLSVVFNITEGFLRRKDKETLQFLRYAFASNGEVKAGYYVCQGRRYISNSQASDLIQLNESIARMLRRWQATLDTENTNSRDQGQRTTRPEGRTKDEGRTEDGDGPSTRDQGRTKD